MAKGAWTTKPYKVASLHLDTKNPRLGRETSSRAPREIIEYLFKYDKAYEVAESIALRGYFPNEPLLAVKENNRLIVVEGNRRLAALKALREPGLLDGTWGRKVARLSKLIKDIEQIAEVPVTVAASRKATDKLIVGRHIGTPVLAWQAENRASFILDKLAEGYDNNTLRDELGFSIADIQQARQTRAIADMARSLDLPEEVKAKIDSPRAKLFTTLERVFDSSVGRNYLMVEPDPNHGLRGITTKPEFLKGFIRLVSDIALGKASSRSLNTNENIKTYFEKLPASDRPAAKAGSFVPADVIEGKSVASSAGEQKLPSFKGKTKVASQTVLPRDFKVRFGSPRLVDIRRELVKMKREDFPNAGAVLLRVFLELAIIDYLSRTGELKVLIDRLKGINRLRFGTPEMHQLVPEILKVAKRRLSASDAAKAEKALSYNSSAPFTLKDLHSFVHQSSELPTERDILQFWLRTEPLFRMMLEQETEGTNATS